MAHRTTTSLRIFMTANELTDVMINVVAQYPNMYKFSIGDETVKTCIRLMRFIFRINREFDPKKRLELMERFKDEFDMLCVLIRIANEKNFYSNRLKGRIAVLKNSVEEQLAGWMSYTKERADGTYQAKQDHKAGKLTRN